MSKVAIITTHYRNTDKFERCIKSVLSKTSGVDFNWYIWANDPDDKVKLMLEGIKEDRLKIFYNSSNNCSFSANNNACIEQSKEPLILLLNDDIEPINNDWLYKMINLIENDENIGVVGACLFYPYGLIQHVGVIFDEKTNGLPYHIYYKQKINPFINNNRIYQAITGACMLFKREDWVKIGKLDENFYYGYEDISFCLDVKEKLKKISVYCSFARLVHHEGISGNFKSHPKLQDNIKYFRKKHKNIINDHQVYLNSKNYNIYKKN